MIDSLAPGEAIELSELPHVYSQLTPSGEVELFESYAQIGELHEERDLGSIGVIVQIQDWVEVFLHCPGVPLQLEMPPVVTQSD